MATAIDPTDLPRHLATYGPRATVITVSGDARPHVGTSLVALDGDRVVLQVGPRAAGYLETHRDLCLTWVPPAGEPYQLIIDATAVEVTPNGDAFRVVAALHAGIRHRVADADPVGPSCVPLDQGR